MFVTDIEEDTLNNTNYRKVLFTNNEQQVVVMSIRVGGDIGAEIHPHTSQFIRIESGVGKSIINGKESKLEAGSVVVVTPGEKHNIINTGDNPLKLYTVYSPPKHERGLIQKDKPAGEEAKKARKLARRMKAHGMDISIETDKGQERHWYNPHNDTHGTTKMKYPYGYIRMTDGADGEQVDTYIGPHPENDTLYIVHQLKAPDFKKFDEDKVMLGFQSFKEAKQAYLMHYSSPKFFGSMTEMKVDDFKNKFLKKALDQLGQQSDQFEQPMMPAYDPYDMNVTQSVQSQLNSIGNMGDNELMKLSEVVWGSGYEYKPVSTNQIRSELRGFLQDQLEWLNIVNPLMSQTDPSFMPDQMPHSSDLSQDLQTGIDGSEDLLQEQTLDGKISQDEMSNPLSRQEYLSQQEEDTQ